MNSSRNLRFVLFVFLIFIAFHPFVSAQTKYTQFSNEVDLLRTLSDRWSLELDLANTYSNTPSENRILKTNVQGNVIAWAHYQFTPRWKFSSFLGYFHNKDVPEIGQYEAPEWRLALQGKYFFHKIGYTLNTDMRVELRFISDEEGVFEDVYRYRQKLKYLQPLNSKMLRKGVFYVFASEEIIFRSKAKETGMTYYDRNLTSVAAGYLITDDLQIELAYINEFVPRDDGNLIYNTISVTLTVNNLVSKVRTMIGGAPPVETSDE
jgi:hypothetical protein